jgi:hypothetical protein
MTSTKVRDLAVYGIVFAAAVLGGYLIGLPLLGGGA